MFLVIIIIITSYGLKVMIRYVCAFVITLIIIIIIIIAFTTLINCTN